MATRLPLNFVKFMKNCRCPINLHIAGNFRMVYGDKHMTVAKNLELAHMSLILQ